MKHLRPEVFELNPRAQIEIKQIGKDGHNVVLIENLFLYANDIATLFDEMVFTSDEAIRANSPCFRAILPQVSYLKPLHRKIFELHYTKYGIEEMNLYQNKVMLDQYWDGSNIIDQSSYHPHTDDLNKTNYAIVIFMNRRNIHGGTQFVKVRHDGRWIENITQDNEDARIRNDEDINSPDPAKPWDYDGIRYKRYHLEPMKFNKLISYRTNVIHSPYTDGSFYRNTPRKIITSTF